MTILLKNIEELYQSGEGQQVIRDAYLIIEGNLIKKVARQKEEEEIDESKFDQVIDGKGKIVLPGLINTHTHAGMTLLRGYADDLPLKTWLEEKIWPFEGKLTADDIYWGSKLAILEMIKTGTTTFTDMYFQMERVAEAVKETGIRAVLTEGLIEANDGEDGLIKAKEFSRAWHNKAEGRVTTMLAPHAPYTCSPDYLERIMQISSDLDLPINIHLAETKQEIEIIKTNFHGLTPVKLLKEVDLFSRPVLAAHCVYVNQEDIEILAEGGVGVAYNPKSNMKLSSGIAPVKAMLDRNIAVGFGTDGVASNNSLDLIEEARVGSYLQKVDTLDPTALNTGQMLEMLTSKAAEAVKINQLGQLKEGYLADLILIDINKPVSFYPHHNNLSNLLYAGQGRDVSTVIINGQIIMQDHQVINIDEEQVYAEIEERASRLA